MLRQHLLYYRGCLCRRILVLQARIIAQSAKPPQIVPISTTGTSATVLLDASQENVGKCPTQRSHAHPQETLVSFPHAIPTMGNAPARPLPMEECAMMATPARSRTVVRMESALEPEPSTATTGTLALRNPVSRSSDAWLSKSAVENAGMGPVEQTRLAHPARRIAENARSHVGMESAIPRKAVPRVPPIVGSVLTSAETRTVPMRKVAEAARRTAESVRIPMGAVRPKAGQMRRLPMRVLCLRIQPGML